MKNQSQAPQEDGASLAAPRAWSINLNGSPKNINETQLRKLLVLYLYAYAQRDVLNPHPPLWETAERFFTGKLQLIEQVEAPEPLLTQSELEGFTKEKMHKLIDAHSAAKARIKRKKADIGLIKDFKELFQQAQTAHKDQVAQQIPGC